MKEFFERKNNISVISGDPKKAVLFLFWPMLLTFLVVAINVYLDSFWAAILGADAASAVNSMGDIYACIASVGAGMGVACAAVITYYLGDKNHEKAESAACHSILVCLLLTVMVGLIMFMVVDPLIDFIGIQDLRGYCHDYIGPMIWCNIVFLINGALCGILRAEGASFRTIVATVLILSSAFFDPLFIIVMDMGVAGAAWGTIAASMLSTSYLLYIFIAKKTAIHIDFGNFKFDSGIVKELFLISGPYGLQTSLRKVASLMARVVIVIVMGASFGGAAIAIYSLPWTYVRVIECLGLAFGAALIPVLSYNIGANNLEKGEAAIRYAIKKALVSSTVVSAIILLLSVPLIELITSDPSFDGHRELMVAFLIIVSLTGPACAIRDVSFNIMQTLRKNNICVILAFGQLFVKITLMYLMGTMFGPIYMAIGDMIAQYIIAIVVLLLSRYYWRRLKVDRIKFTGRQKEIMKKIENMG